MGSLDDIRERRAAVTAQLCGPDGPFATTTETVLGEPMDVFAQRPGSIRELLAAAASHGDQEYAVFGPRRITFADHVATVGSVAAAMRDRHGIGPGDRVAMWGANSYEYLVAWFATVSLGAIFTALNGWWVGEEARHGLALSEPSLLIADRKRLDRLEGDDPGVPFVLVDPAAADDGTVGFGTLEAHAPGAPLPDTPIAEDDPALILFTSGTTGRPKGAVLTHRNIVALCQIQAVNGAVAAALQPPSTPSPHATCAYSASPMFHVSGLLNVGTGMVFVGGKVVWGTGRFDPAEVMATVERERCTSMSIFGTTAWRMLQHPDFGRWDLSSLSGMGGGGAPISPALQEQLRAAVPSVEGRVSIGYGLTESTSLATTATGAELGIDPNTVGVPLPLTQVEIRDPDGRALPDGDEGEICVRSPLVMLGYWRQPDATAEAIGPGRWLRTGDIGFLRDGYLYLGSRRRDLILRGAENIYPVEIENVLEGHPDVAEAAVLGVDHEELGQEVKAIVVPRTGRVLDPADLAAFVAQHLAYFKVPAHWELRDEPLPRNASGKILKHVLETGDASSFVED
jgi:long-chain acyl-CoA synthetase